MVYSTKSIINFRHPMYNQDELDWSKWRECYEGGELYVDTYLKKFDKESDPEFADRKDMAPIQTYAASAINDIRNSIFQRLSDVTRRDGSNTFLEAVEGNNGGVDNKGTSMQSFIGINILTELLIMGRVGVYVDAPEINGPTLFEAQGIRPYVYYYPVEDILSWTVSKPEQPGDFQAILLRDRGLDYAQTTDIQGISLPDGSYERYRLIWIDQLTGKVNLRFYNEDGRQIDNGGNLSDRVYQLELTSIPFTMPNIGSSLLKNICNHQKALLNLESSNVTYCLKANHPFLTIQEDARAVGRHRKEYVDDDGTTGTTRNESPGRDINVGTRVGRVYGMKAERPGFIHPSSEPLLATIQLQEKLEDDIRKLVNLAVQNKSGRRHMAAETKKISDQGLEAGLSYIGLVLEGAERQIAQHWAAYEERNRRKRRVAVIKYPSRYYLKTDKDRIEESKKLSELVYTVPSRSAKQEIAKTIVSTLLGGRVSVERLEKINSEIEKADFTTSDPDTIIRAVETGLCGDQTGSVALGFTVDEYLKAQEDHANRAERIAEAQSKGRGDDTENMAARGIEDLDADKSSGSSEREEASDQTTAFNRKKPVRGDGKAIVKKTQDI